MSTIVSDRQTCAPWCATHGDDSCYSVERETAITLHEPWDMSDGTTQSAQISARARRDAGSPTHVVLLTPDDDEVNLTPYQARELARSLEHYAWVAERS